MSDTSICVITQFHNIFVLHNIFGWLTTEFKQFYERAKWVHNTVMRCGNRVIKHESCLGYYLILVGELNCKSIYFSTILKSFGEMI